MGVDTFESDDRGAQRDIARPRAQMPRFARYRLDVIGSDVADVVSSAGGWLFDRAMAGWDVGVAVPGDADARPLEILGVRTLPLPALLAAEKSSAPSALAVAEGLCSTHDGVREAVAAAVRSNRNEVTVWGDPWGTSLGQRGNEVRHVLSAAARAFKAQALAAAGQGRAAVAPFEAFRSHGRWCRTEFPDLLPVG